MKGWILVFSLTSVCVIPWFSGNNVLVQAAAVRFPKTQTAPSNHDQEASAASTSGQTMEHKVNMIGTGPLIVQGFVPSSDTFDHHAHPRSIDDEGSVDAYSGYDDESFDAAAYDEYTAGDLSSYRFKRAADSGTGTDATTTAPSPDQLRAMPNPKLPRPFNLNPPPPPDPQFFQPTFFGLGSNSNSGMLNRLSPGSSGKSGTLSAGQNPQSTPQSGQPPTVNQFGQQQPTMTQPRQPAMPQSSQQSTMQQPSQQSTMQQPSQQPTMQQTGQPTMPQPAQQSTAQQSTAQQPAMQQSGQQMSPTSQTGPNTPTNRRQGEQPEPRPPSSSPQQMPPSAPGMQTGPMRREVDPSLQTPTGPPSPPLMRPNDMQNPIQQQQPAFMPPFTQGFQQTMPFGAMNPFGGMMPFGMNQPFFGSPFGMSPLFGFPPNTPFNMFSFVPGRGGMFLTNSDMQPMRPMQMPPPAQPISSQMGGASPRIFARDTTNKVDKTATSTSTSTTPNPLNTSTPPTASTTTHPSTQLHFNFDPQGRNTAPNPGESNAPAGSGTTPISRPAPQLQFHHQPQFTPNFSDQNPFQMNPFFNPFVFPNFAQFPLPPGGGNPMLLPDQQFMGPFQTPPNGGQPPFNMPPFPTQQFPNQFPPQANFRGQAPFQTRSTNQTATPPPKDQTTTTTPHPTTPHTTKEKL